VLFVLKEEFALISSIEINCYFFFLNRVFYSNAKGCYFIGINNMVFIW